MSRDYYELLGIPRNASDKEVKQAYRRLARKLHPDVNPGSKEAEARFKEINEAYEVLSNPETRRKYDQFGENWRYADRVVSSGSRQAPFERTFDDGFDLGGGLFDSDLGDLFGRFFGGRTRTHRRTIEYPVEVNLEEAFAGTTRFIKTTSLEACNTCGSSGRVNRARCPNCGGSGTMPRLRRLEVKIPPGVDTGSRISVPGGGGEQIILRVSVQRHRRVERKGADLFAEAQVPLYDALLGGEVPVQTLKGRVMLSIPPETQNGRVFRLSGQGMPRLNSSDGRGDLYATVRVVLPSGLSEHEKAKLQELKALRVQAR